MRRPRDLFRLSGRDREDLVQAAKAAFAAVLAWLIARQIAGRVDDVQSFIAPYAAVFMMSGTVLRSLQSAALQTATMVLGVLVAFVAAALVPWPWAALAVAVFAGLLIGRWRRLGTDGIWVGVVALLMVTYGTAGDVGYLLARVGEGVLGAVVGVAVNTLLLPPMRLREGDRAVTAAATEIAGLLRTIAEGLRTGWDHDTARRWRRDAGALEAAVREADDAEAGERESTRLNPRALGRRYQPQESVLGALFEVAEQVRHVTKTLFASADPDDTAPRTGVVFDRSYAGLLCEVAAAVDVYRAPAAERTVDPDAIAAALDRARGQRSALARQEPWPDHQPPEDWSAHAALVLAAERALRALRDVRH